MFNTTNAPKKIARDEEFFVMEKAKPLQMSFGAALVC
jgi:hypothetical protein